MMKTLLMGCALVFCLPAFGKDFGRVGAVFPIGEIDMLVWIEHRLKGFEASGKLSAMKAEFAQRVTNRYENPTPIELTTTQTPKAFTVDPSLVIPKDIVNPLNGEVIVKKGTLINPFDVKTWPYAPKHRAVEHFELSKDLAFFDARDPQQVAWAKQFTSDKTVKWVLTGGSPNQVSQWLNDRIYFDQQGNLTRALHIQHVPSVAAQHHTQWLVTEFDVSDLAPFEEDRP